MTIKIFILIITALIALLSLCYSIIAQIGNSFQQLFTSMVNILNNHFSSEISFKPISEKQKNLFEEKCNKTPLKSVFNDLCSYFEESVQANKENVISEEFTYEIWKKYVSQLDKRSEFEHTFKLLYDCISIVDNAKICKKQKKHYMRILADTLNSEQIFCYMLNLTHYSHCSNNNEEDYKEKQQYISKLKDYNFFRDLKRCPISLPDKVHFEEEYVNQFSDEFHTHNNG